MTIILILIYILSVLFARYLNYLSIKFNVYNDIEVASWFIPLLQWIFIFFIGCSILYERYRFLKNFLGENWEEKEKTLELEDKSKLDDIDICTIEKYLREKKLKKLS